MGFSGFELASLWVLDIPSVGGLESGGVTGFWGSQGNKRGKLVTLRKAVKTVWH